MSDPLSFDFWNDEEAYMWAEMNPHVMDALLQGMTTAATQLPPAIAGLVDWDFTNTAALEFLNQYRLSTVSGIVGTTRDQTIRLIQRWMASGDELPVLIQQLAPIYGHARAEAIAVTEVTRVFAEGNMILWDSTGVVAGKRWQTARDERVCPFCAPLHNTIVELQSDFSLTPDAVANSGAMRQLLGDRYTPEAAMARARTLLGRQGTTVKAPPYHPRCRCWLQPFLSETSVRRGIGDVLANEFFAEVRAGQWPRVAVDTFVAQGVTP